MALVKFVTATAASFATATKDEGTLYFVTDTQTLYKGSTPYSGGLYKAVTADPESPEINTLYINTEDGSVKFYNGSALVTVVKPYTTAITGAGDNDHGVTSKAVVDYLADKISDLDVGALEGRMTAVETKATNNESAIATLNGSGEGSVAKAAADAQAAAEATAATDATKKADAAQAAAEKTAADALVAAQTALEGEIAKKADKATTLAGYGITDAYTKAETDSEIKTAVANAHHLKRAIVDELPAVADADEDTIYMVPKAAGSTGSGTNQSYTEYMVINGVFEIIGDSAVDLTDYAKTADVESKIATAKTEAINTAADDATTKANAAQAAAITAAATDATTKANAAQAAAEATAAADATTKANAAQAAAEKTAAADATKKADQALADAKAYIEEKSGDYATAAQGAKADTALQAADIATGATNGTISVKGSDIAVKGLGSAAYTDSSAYDVSGAAATAEQNAKTYTDTALTWGTL